METEYNWKEYENNSVIIIKNNINDVINDIDLIFS